MKVSTVIKQMYCGLFATRSTPDEALKFAHDLLPDDKQAVTTAVMVYANTMLRVLQNNAKCPDTEVCGADIIYVYEGETKGELAARLYPNTIIDCAVPQSFIDKMSRVFDDPARHFVTVYKNHAYDNPKAGNIQMMDGVIMPITDEGIYMLACVANWR